MDFMANRLRIFTTLFAMTAIALLGYRRRVGASALGASNAPAALSRATMTLGAETGFADTMPAVMSNGIRPERLANPLG
jgi:hypothetical protein